MTSSEIQQIIDDNKESIPDNVYLSISNLNKKKYEEESVFFVEIHFLTTKLLRPKQIEYNIGLDARTQIIQCTEEEFKDIENTLNKYKVCYKNITQLNSHYLKNVFDKLIGNNVECLETFDCEDDCISEFYIKNEIIITEIKKM
jgi:hypothetical protein